MVLAALGSRLDVPKPVYKLIVLLLLIKVGLGAGIAMRQVDLLSLLVPTLGAALIVVVIVLLGRVVLLHWQRLPQMDAMATAGLFGAASASTLVVGMAMLDAQGIAYEGLVGAQGGLVREILVDTIKSPAISALLLGLALGLLARPDQVYASFYEPLFKGLLSVMILVMEIEAWARLADLRKVALVYVVYGLTAPSVHGLIGFGIGLLAHQITGFSAGGIVLLAVMAASSSDISGPPHYAPPCLMRMPPPMSAHPRGWASPLRSCRSRCGSPWRRR